MRMPMLPQPINSSSISKNTSMDPKPMCCFLLCLKVSSERLAIERGELLPLLESKREELPPPSDHSRKREEKSELPEKKTKREEKSELPEKKTKRVKKETRVDHNLPALFVDLNDEPNLFWTELKATKPTFAFSRRLERSDVRKSQSRCFLNREEMEAVLVPALTKDERDDMMELSKGLKLVVVDDTCNRYEMVLKWWPSIKQFALNKGWMKLVDDSHLAAGDLIRVSYFRYGDGKKLGLLFDCRRPELREPGGETIDDVTRES